MKTRAYVIDKKTKDYMRDDKGNHLIVDVNEALDIRDNPLSYREQIHSNRTYMTRNPIPERRVKLFPHRGKKSNYYTFEKGVTAIGDHSYDETFSHEAAVDVISNLKEMHIYANGEHYYFEFSNVYREPRLELPNGKFFYPDILCTFDKELYPEAYAVWGGKIVIEVTNTHACEEDKLHEFELCNIPVFEFKITKSRMYPPERDKNRVDTNYSRIRHLNNLNDWFVNDGIGLDLIINPVSTAISEARCNELNVHIEKQNDLINKLSNANRKLQRHVNRADSLNDDNSKVIDNLKIDINALKKKLRKQEQDVSSKNEIIDDYKKSLKNANSVIEFWFYSFWVSFILLVVTSFLEEIQGFIN